MLHPQSGILFAQAFQFRFHTIITLWILLQTIFALIALYPSIQGFMADSKTVDYSQHTFITV